MQPYGTAIKWSTIDAPNPTGGTCEDYSYKDAFQVDDHDDESGDYLAHILHTPKGEISFSTVLIEGALVPVLESGCKTAITGITTGGVLFSQIVETWSLNQKRQLQCSASHFPDLGTGASGDDAGEGALDEFTVAPLVVPAGKVGWGTGGVVSALGIVQSFKITQKVKLNEYPDNGKIVSVVACAYELMFELQVLAYAAAAAPAKGNALTLSTAPTRFQESNFIADVGTGYRKGNGVMYDISARWTPALAA